MTSKIRKFATAAMFAAASLATMEGSAGERDPRTTVTLVGYNNNQPVYKVEIRNPENLRLRVVIRNADGDVLHEEAVQGTEVTKAYRIVRQEVGRGELFVEVSRLEDPLVSRIRLENKGSK
jgi:hypothetical protein